MIWIIGDIHGRFDPLKRLVTYLKTKSLQNERFKIDKFIFLGDYIDYGSCSKEVIDYLIDLEYEKIFLAGNHEDLLLQFYNKSKLFKDFGNVWFNGNGGQETIASFTSSKEVLAKVFEVSSFSDRIGRNFEPEHFRPDDKYMDFFNNLQYSHIEEYDMNDYSQGDPPLKFAFVHAGLNADLDIEEQLSIKTYNDFHKYCKENNIWIEDTTIWTRSEPSKRFGDYIVVHGHTPTNTLPNYYKQLANYDAASGLPYFRFENPDKRSYNEYKTTVLSQNIRKLVSINMDTGSAFGYKLTALGIDYLSLVSGELMTVQVDVGASQRRKDDISEWRFKIYY